jgi:hypothetical protein
VCETKLNVCVQGKIPDNLWEPEQTCVGTKGDICGNVGQTYVWNLRCEVLMYSRPSVGNQSRHMCGTRMSGVEQTIYGKPDYTFVGS